MRLDSLQLTPVQPLRAASSVSRPAAPFSAPAATSRAATLQKPDQLLRSRAAQGPVPASPISLFETQPAAGLPESPHTPEDYGRIFDWVEQVTGAPIALQTPKARQAYIEAIQGKPQQAYDTQGFLDSIGVHNARTYGRDDRGVHRLVTSIDGFSPHSHHVSKPLQIAQKTFFWVFKTFPKTFDKIANLVDKHYFTRKDNKAQSWINVPVPQPGISPDEPLLPPQQVKASYNGNLFSRYLKQGQLPSTQVIFDRYFSHNPPKEIGLLFEHDFHKGVPQPGETPHNYGTYAIARQLGFSHEQATRFGTANYDMDLNNTIYGDTDAFPDAKPSRHFNLNKERPEQGDTRFIWAQKHLEAAVELARRGRFDQAERELGYGLHSIQDAFAHGHIRLASHAVTGQIPDGVPYNPVGAYEATKATIGYLKAYIERIEAL